MSEQAIMAMNTMGYRKQERIQIGYKDQPLKISKKSALINRILQKRISSKEIEETAKKIGLEAYYQLKEVERIQNPIDSLMNKNRNGSNVEDLKKLVEYTNSIDQSL
jgi:hypothetical protein